MNKPHTERAGVEQTWDALTAAGYSITAWDGTGEEFPGLERDDAIREVMSCDDGHFIVFKNGERVGWVWFVFGNDPVEVISDYTLTLMHILDPLTDGWYE